jgi:hypothetical protein
MIDVDTYMKWYLSIMSHFIHLLDHISKDIHIIQCIMFPNIQDKIDWYAILFYIQHLFNILMLLYMMTTN